MALRKKKDAASKKKLNDISKKKINKRNLRKGTYSATLSAIVIAVVVLLNLVIGQIPSKYTEIDISTGKLYTIGDTTKEVLKSLEEDITIYYVVQTGNEDSNIEKLLQQYTEISDKITIEKRDPVANPTFVSQYTDESLYENSLIVESGQRSKIVSYNNMYETELDYSTYQSKTTGFDGEGQITSAINYVVSDNLPVVYYVEGHNEVSIPDALNDRIQKANLDLQSLNLLTSESVPEDAACILLNSPEKDYSAQEADKVIEYLENGGKAIILTDYIGDALENYNRILSSYGIEVVNGIVIETDNNMYVQQPYYIVPEIGYSDITADMRGGSANVLLSGCQGFYIPEDVSETLDITTLLSPSEDAYVKTDPQNMTTYDMEEGDQEGSFLVAAAISKTVSADTETADDSSDTEGESSEEMSTEEQTTKIVCVSSSSVLDENMNSMVSDGNYNLYMNSLSWLVDSGDNATVSIASKSVAVEYLTVTTGSSAILGFLLCILLPLACLITGGVICHMRKKR